MNRELFAVSDGVWQVRECAAQTFLMDNRSNSVRNEQEFFSLAQASAHIEALVHQFATSRSICPRLAHVFVIGASLLRSKRPLLDHALGLVTVDAHQSRQYAFRGSAPLNCARGWA